MAQQNSDGVKSLLGSLAMSDTTIRMVIFNLLFK